MKKAQVTITDLIMSIAIFISIFAFVIFFWTSTTSRLERDINYEETQLRAIRIADQLTKTTGSPSRWEILVNTNEFNKIESLGLATEDRSLSSLKLFNLTDIEYNEIIKLLNIEGYDFNITVKIKDDILTLLKKFDIRVAYLQTGAKSFPESLRAQLQGLFNCKDVRTITDRNEERCEEYTTAASIDNPDGACPPGCAFADDFNVFENLSDYDLIVMEDPRLFKQTGQGEPTFRHSENITQYIEKGGFAIFTIALSTNTSINTLGIRWIDGSSGGPNPLMILQPEYYNAKDQGDERFILLPGTAENPAELDTNKPRAHVTQGIGAENFLKISNSSLETGITTGARWEFGNGRVYYFSDGKDLIISDKVGVAAKLIVLDLADTLFTNLINSGKVPPKDADIVTVQRDVLFNNQTAIFEFSLWQK